MNVHVAPSFSDLLYRLLVTEGGLLKQMKVTDDALEGRSATPEHWTAQAIAGAPRELTLLELCAYRPANSDEAAAKGAWLINYLVGADLGDDEIHALVRSLMPDPGTTVASLFAEWWRLDQLVSDEEAEDPATSERMSELEKQMLEIPTVTAADLAMKIIVSTYHGDFGPGKALTRELYPLAGVRLPSHMRGGDETD